MIIFLPVVIVLKVVCSVVPLVLMLSSTSQIPFSSILLENSSSVLSSIQDSKKLIALL